MTATQSRWAPLYQHDKQDWGTPPVLFNQLDAEFHFTLDPCASHANRKCDNYFTIEDNGLVQDWGNNVVFCNPPYNRIVEWARKCWLASQAGATVVLLTFARTDTRYFHDYIYHKAELRFIKGRIRFVGAANSAPAPSMLAIYRPAPTNKETYNDNR